MICVCGFEMEEGIPEQCPDCGRDTDPGPVGPVPGGSYLERFTRRMIRPDEDEYPQWERDEEDRR